MTRYGFVVDTHRCIGCHSCAVACKVANNLPEGMQYNRVLTDDSDYLDVAQGAYPNLSLGHVPLACQHCANPACVAACPTGATYKDEETGIVMQDTDVCIGCESCIAACPYPGVRTLQAVDPVYSVDFSVGNQTAPAHKVQTVEKCTMCFAELEQGRQPACMDLCPARARFFGDFDDPNSEVSKLRASSTRSVYQLLPEEGTDPSVYYLA